MNLREVKPSRHYQMDDYLSKMIRQHPLYRDTYPAGESNGRPIMAPYQAEADTDRLQEFLFRRLIGRLTNHGSPLEGRFR